MFSITVEGASAILSELLARVTQSHTPILITGKRANAVLISEDDWHSIQETVDLLSVPGIRESIRDGLKVPINACSDQLDW
jgi:antitoxin YefM